MSYFSSASHFTDSRLGKDTLIPLYRQPVGKRHNNPTLQTAGWDETYSSHFTDSWLEKDTLILLYREQVGKRHTHPTLQTAGWDEIHSSHFTDSWLEKDTLVLLYRQSVGKWHTHPTLQTAGWKKTHSSYFTDSRLGNDTLIPLYRQPIWKRHTLTFLVVCFEQWGSIFGGVLRCKLMTNAFNSSGRLNQGTKFGGCKNLGSLFWECIAIDYLWPPPLLPNLANLVILGSV